MGCCAGDDNPFVSHAFLSAVEDSGSAGPRTGWLPQHAALRDETGRLVAAAPMYAKANSYGEYVFDHGWANAYEQAGGNYYPKLQVAVPFSPVPGPRLLCNPAAGVAPGALGQALVQACEELKLSGVHVTFCSAGDWDALGSAGWLQRLGQQYHWENAGYGCFDDFLGALSSRKRKVLRRERRDANDCGLTFRALQGPEIGKHHWDAFYRFYQSTVDRKWGSAYLTRRFFPLLGERAGRAGGADAGGARWRACGRRAEPRRTGRAVRPQLGMQRRLPVPALRAVLLPGRSTTPSRTACSGWRPGRRASTRSSAATCRSRPTPPIG